MLLHPDASTFSDAITRQERAAQLHQKEHPPGHGIANNTNQIDSYRNHVHETQTLHRLPLRNPCFRSLYTNIFLQLAANPPTKFLPPEQDLRTTTLSIRLEATSRIYTPRRSHITKPQQSNTETLPRCPTRGITNPWYASPALLMYSGNILTSHYSIDSRKTLFSTKGTTTRFTTALTTIASVPIPSVTISTARGAPKIDTTFLLASTTSGTNTAI